MAAAPCKECGRRPKALPAQRCLTCQLRHLPIGDQVAASRKRLAMVPLELRVKRNKAMQALAPDDTAWCAACQSFRDDVDFAKNATTCRSCSSAKAHGAMIEKTYGLTAEEYDMLLERQGGKCAICRAKPKSQRLAVDHDHKTGAVRGLLCSRCNHELMGAAWDSKAMATALWHYINTPPATGRWLPPETAGELEPASGSQRPSKGLAPAGAPLLVTAGKVGRRHQGEPIEPDSVDMFTPTDVAAGIFAGLALEPPVAHALWGELDRYLRRVDPAPF